MQPPSGAQWEIRRGGQRAVVVEVGGGLREYDIDGKPVLDGYAIDRMADGGRGQPLFPWPNRLADGQYTFGGQQLQLPIDEMERHNAIHGLTRWLNWSLAEHQSNVVRVELVIHPRPGYPYALRLAITYALEDDGLHVRTRAQNLGNQALPFGAGQHPYFTVGTPLVDQATLQVPSLHRLELDQERRLPTSKTLAVETTEFDFRTPRLIGPLVIYECFSALIRDAAGRAHITLTNPIIKQAVAVWLDEHYNYVQVFSGDTLAQDRRRRGLAIEPLTCPPNAFQTRTDLIVLQPGDTIELDWGIEFDNGLTRS